MTKYRVKIFISKISRRTFNLSPTRTLDNEYMCRSHFIQLTVCLVAGPGLATCWRLCWAPLVKVTSRPPPRLLMLASWLPYCENTACSTSAIMHTMTHHQAAAQV